VIIGFIMVGVTLVAVVRWVYTIAPRRLESDTKWLEELRDDGMTQLRGLRQRVWELEDQLRGQEGGPEQTEETRRQAKAKRDRERAEIDDLRARLAK